MYSVVIYCKAVAKWFLFPWSVFSLGLRQDTRLRFANDSPHSRSARARWRRRPHWHRVVADARVGVANLPRNSRALSRIFFLSHFLRRKSFVPDFDWPIQNMQILAWAGAWQNVFCIWFWLARTNGLRNEGSQRCRITCSSCEPSLSLRSSKATRYFPSNKPDYLKVAGTYIIIKSCAGTVVLSCPCK